MRQVRVLVVDDDVDFAESLALALRSQDYEVVLAHSGEEAIARFREQDFAIAFMDVRLTGKNGVESFLEIRQFKPEAKVVMMTGHSVEELLGQAVDNGAWGVLRKPFDMRQIFEIMTRIESGGILIADDDPDFIDSMKVLLESYGKTVVVARNGQETIECIQSDDIGVLILDLRMPILDGLEVYLELRRAGHVIPTIIVTAYAAEEAEKLATLRSLLVNAILHKPFAAEDLIEAVKRLSVSS